MIWTFEEITAHPETGQWFYGLVWDKGLWPAEIFPGLGYVRTLPYPNLHSWRWFVSDVLSTKRRKG